MLTFSIILFSDNVMVDFYGNETPEFKGSKNGRMYLTTHRMIYNSKNNSDIMRSFSFPFIQLQDVSIRPYTMKYNYIVLILLESMINGLPQEVYMLLKVNPPSL